MPYLIISVLFFTICFISLDPAISLEGNHKDLDNLVDKISTKFSNTYCNTSGFGISAEGAIEFAIGETNKEFSRHKNIAYLNSDDINNKIVTKVEDKCQAFEFPIKELARLNFNKIK